ncbi:MAG: DUF2786 domain-containing protein [Proteobacteria bacterium]|nr:DUF2786 domain-containing protein [Pseudomonadota bacterium]MCG6934933.1 DUF2786 domain-containing protein [Pseudomonadota bacterium]
MDYRKIIDKIAKCLRLSESGNPNEAASALRQARRLMHKYAVSEDDVRAAEVAEAAINTGLDYTPPFWVLALGNLVARAFDCEMFLARHFGCPPEYRFIGLGHGPKVATYTFRVLLRQLNLSRDNFIAGMSEFDADERQRRGDVFAQAWLFRVARTVTEFVTNERTRKAVAAHIRSEYGETAEILTDPVAMESRDFDAIRYGMRAAEDVSLLRSMAVHPVCRYLLSA